MRGLNHTSLAREALRFRLASVHGVIDPNRFDIDAAAAFALSLGDPVVDAAIRRIGTAWLGAGLPPERICQPWQPDDVERLLDHAALCVIDALDDIVATINAHAVFT